jgi:hypothetical protein
MLPYASNELNDRPSCFDQKGGGVFQRLFDKFKLWCSAGRHHVHRIDIQPHVTTHTSRVIRINDAHTAETREYTRLEDVPAEMRSMLEAVGKLGAMPDSPAEVEPIPSLPCSPNAETVHIEHRRGPEIQLEIRPNGAGGSEYIYREDGEEYVFDSLDDLPDDVKRAFVHAQRVLDTQPR